MYMFPSTAPRPAPRSASAAPAAPAASAVAAPPSSPTPGVALLPGLDHPAYHVRVKLRNYNSSVSALTAHCASVAAKILIKVHPQWGREDHERLALAHAAAACDLRRQYAQALQAAAWETFGRPWEASDYRVSAIGSDAFSAERKQELRFAAHAFVHHEDLARAHDAAARATPSTPFVASTRAVSA